MTEGMKKNFIHLHIFFLSFIKIGFILDHLTYSFLFWLYSFYFIISNRILFFLLFSYSNNTFN